MTKPYIAMIKFQKEPGFYDANVNKGVLLQSLKKYDEAIVHFDSAIDDIQEALKMDFENKRVIIIRGFLLFKIYLQQQNIKTNLIE